MMKKVILLLILLWNIPTILLGQEYAAVITGVVKDKETRHPIAGVEVRVSGKKGVFTDRYGAFTIKAKVGEELVIQHDSFATIFYTIVDAQKIEIFAEDHATVKVPKVSSRSKWGSNAAALAYTENLVAAKKQYKKDASVGIEYITLALEAIEDEDLNAYHKKAVLFETLADIYKYWKQPDLAENNYKISLQHQKNPSVTIKLGEIQVVQKEYGTALQTYAKLSSKTLTTAEQVDFYQGIADCYYGMKVYKKAITNYKKASELSKKNSMASRIILLDSKLAAVLQKQGNVKGAAVYMGNSVKLASKSDKKTAARQRSKAADFYNKNNSYDKEIELRREAIEDIEAITKQESVSEEAIESKEKALTTQVQNYKIGTAYAAQSEYDEAIPYLKESIKEAKSKNDLVVQKDATRKLGELYRAKGELKKAAETFRIYEAIIDKLYIQKEQEITQAARFSRKLSESQNRINSLEKDRALNESRYQLSYTAQQLALDKSLRQRIIIYFLIGLTALLLLAGYLMFRNMKQQRYANYTLELKSLRSQMNPHFIFNALNSVNTFIATNDERAANRYLTDFSLLMRAVLENSEEDFIPLEKEIELLNLYVQLEHFRFQDKFEYTITVDPAIDVSSYMIPPMLLQPYVENAVWHGLRYREDKGMLSIRFDQITGHSISIHIEDNGIGRKKSVALKTKHQKKQNSKGMSNIQKRITILNAMYKDRVDVSISDLNADSSGTKVQLVLNKDR